MADDDREAGTSERVQDLVLRSALWTAGYLRRLLPLLRVKVLAMGGPLARQAGRGVGSREEDASEGSAARDRDRASRTCGARRRDDNLHGWWRLLCMRPWPHADRARGQHLYHAVHAVGAHRRRHYGQVRHPASAAVHHAVRVRAPLARSRASGTCKCGRRARSTPEP